MLLSSRWPNPRSERRREPSQLPLRTLVLWVFAVDAAVADIVSALVKAF